MAVCGADGEKYAIVPGRSGPELGAAIYQVEKYLGDSMELGQSYAQHKTKPFKDAVGLFPAEEFPQLQPYRNLDVSRLKIVGEGKWPMEKFLTDPFWLPFQEPRFLLHNEDDDFSVWPSFKVEKKSENLKLAKLWDQQGLLELHEAPLQPNHFCKVFNAYKDPLIDRQIGDRRIPNSRERSIDGPSHFLPPGFLLTNLRTRPFVETMLGSVTDRRDFYHQAQVSSERARCNMLPFSFSPDAFAGTKAAAKYVESKSRQKRGKPPREVAGDGFGLLPEASSGLKNGKLHPCFASLFQGDHLGVEFALSAHEEVLRRGGLLRPERRLQGHAVFPTGGNYEGLIIDDYFAIGVEDFGCEPINSFASRALAEARRVYDQHAILGSTEKDIEASDHFKAAGAEIISTAEAVRKGVVSVAAPWSKRLALSVLSLRSACLPCLSSRVLSRMAGNWVSVLMYRRCFSAVVDQLFGLAADAERHGQNVLLPLPRSAAQELLILSAFAPVIMTNIAAKVSGKVFASDASLGLGAVVSTEVECGFAEAVWLGSDKRGCYSRLDAEHLSLLAAAGEETHELQTGLEESEAQDLTSQGPFALLCLCRVLWWIGKGFCMHGKPGS